MESFFILGLGRSGRAVAEFLANNSFSFSVWDDHEPTRDFALSKGWVLSDTFPKGTTLIIAPGIGHHRLKDEALSLSSPIISDVQLFFNFFPSVASVGITGTYGKSTTCSLIAYELDALGIPVVLAGNIGIPLFSIVKKVNEVLTSLYVIEVSSYQLEYTSYLPFKVAVLLNVAPHHLARHGSLEAYTAVKRKIFDHATMGWEGFSGKEGVMLDKFPHQENASTALEVIRCLGYQPRSTPFKGFQGLSHRQEYVGCFSGVTYWNDSKATSPYAVASALKNCPPGPLLWIAGGVNHDDDHTVITPFLSRITHGFFIGESAAMWGAFCAHHSIPFTLSGTLEQALLDASSLSFTLSPCHIMLSPGCASFDQFKDFEERGNLFKNLIKERNP